MAIEHDAISDGERHEPKGISGATAGQTYVANGAGSGAWTSPAPDKYYLSVQIDDISTADTKYLPIPFAGTVTKVTSVLEGPITVANGEIALLNSAAGLMGAVDIAFSGSAIGDVDTLIPSSNNVVADNDFIIVDCLGSSTTAQRVWLTVEITRS